MPDEFLSPLTDFEVVQETPAEANPAQDLAPETQSAPEGLSPLPDFEVVSQDTKESVFDEKRGASYEVPSGSTPKETEYMIRTDVEKIDKGSFFGMIEVGDLAQGNFAGVGAGDNPTAEVADNFFKGILNRVVSTVGQLGSLMEEAGDEGASGLAIPGFVEGVRALRKLRDDAGDMFPVTPMHEAIATAGRDLMSGVDSIISQNELQPTSEEGAAKFSFDLGSGAASIATSIGMLYMMKNPAAVGVLFGGMQKGDMYQEALAAGKSLDDASLISTLSGTIEGAIEMVGGEVFLRAVAFDKVLVRTLIRAASDGGQELLQQGGEEAVAKVFGLRDDKLQDVLFRIMYAGLLGVILGAPAGAVTTVAEKQGLLRKLTEEVGLNAEQAKEVMMKISEKGFQDGQAQKAIMQMVMDEAGGVSMTKEERKSRAAEAKKEFQAQIEKVLASVPDTADTIKPGFENALVAGRLIRLEKQSQDLLDKIDQLEREQKARQEDDKPVVALEKQIMKLVDQYNVIDEEMANLLIDKNPNDIRRAPIQMSSETLRSLEEKVIKQSKRLQERVAKVATIEERKRIREANRIMAQIKKADIKSISQVQRRKIQALQEQATTVRTLAGLRELNSIIQDLKQKGKEDFAAIKELKDGLYNARRELLLSVLETGKPKEAKTAATKREDTIVEKVRALTLRSPRLLDMFDGGQDFKGPFYQIFYGLVNSAFNEEVSMINKMSARGMEILDKYKIKSDDLARTMTVDGVTVNMSEAMHIYGALGNEENLAAIVHGNGIPIQTVNRIVEMLPRRFQGAAEEIVAELGAHYTRTRLAYIDYTDGQKDLLQVKGAYIPMHRQEVSYESTEEEIAAELMDRVNFRKVYAEKGFTVQRRTLTEERQTPIFLGLVESYFRHIGTREHFIAMGKTIKELQRLRNDREIRQGIQDRYGPEAVTSFETYLDRVANPHVYRADKAISKIVTALRHSAAVVHLAWNVGVMMKQPVSLARFMGDAGPLEVLSATQELVSNWDEKVKFIHERDPQMEARQITREFDEMKKIDPAKHKGLAKFLDKFGRAGFEGIKILDQFTTHAGWLAVYNNAKQRGASEQDAIEMAQASVLRSQPASAAKDIARIYGSDPFLDLMLQFTDQLSQDWNTLTYDIPMRWKMGRRKSAALGFAGMVTQTLLIWMVSHARLPDDEEELADVLWEFTSLVPVAGPLINGLRNGYSNLPPGLELYIAKPAQAVTALAKGDLGKFLDNSLYFVAGAKKISYTAIRRAALGGFALAQGDTEDFRRLIYSESALENEE